MVAPGTTAPVGSVTVPCTAPALPPCAWADHGEKARATRKMMQYLAPNLNGINRPPKGGWMLRTLAAINKHAANSCNGHALRFQVSLGRYVGTAASRGRQRRRHGAEGETERRASRRPGEGV